METILKSLRDLDGVTGTFLADTSGQLYAYNAESIYDATLLGQVSKAIANALDSVKLLQEDWETITAQFIEGRLLLRSIPAGTRKAGAQLTLALIADSRLNPSFASVAVRVAIGKIKSLMEANGGVLPAPAAAASVGAVPAAAQAFPSNSTLVAAPPVATAGHSAVAAPEVAGSGLSWSGFGSSSMMSTSGVSVADAASSAALSACTKCLAKAVGPMAKVFVKDAVRRVAGGQPFGKNMLPALVTELEKNIEDPADAKDFRKAAAKLE
jgi:hypothetical protein